MDGDLSMASERHFKQRALLVESLEHAWNQRQDFYIGSHLGLYFCEDQLRENHFRAPDLFVVLGTQKREHKSWVVWQEQGKTPTVVIEFLSPSTEAEARGERMKIYAQVLGVQGYYLFDPFNSILEGYALDPARGSYQALMPLVNGDLPCPWLQLHLGIRSSDYLGLQAPWLRWLQEDGQPLPTGKELELAAKQSILAAKPSYFTAKRPCFPSKRIDSFEKDHKHIPKEQLATLPTDLIDIENWSKGAKKHRIPFNKHVSTL